MSATTIEALRNSVGLPETMPRYLPWYSTCLYPPYYLASNGLVERSVQTFEDLYDSSQLYWEVIPSALEEVANAVGIAPSAHWQKHSFRNNGNWRTIVL
jgi:hypothetical protein